MLSPTQNLTSENEVAGVAESLALEKLMLLTDIEEIHAQLRLLNDEETRIDSDLDAILRNNVDVERNLELLDIIRPQLSRLKLESGGMSRTLNTTSHLAEKISDKVRQLDLEQSRVKATVNLVEDVRDLQRCAVRVNQAMEGEDWEEAGAQIKRFLAFDQTLLDSLFSGDGNGSYFVGGGNVDSLTATSSPVGVLRAARRRLTEIAVDRFDRATENGNDEEVARSFKLFPLVGEHDIGLDKLAGFVCGLIARQSRDAMRDATDRAQTMYADLLTRLFETVANAIARQQPMIEAHYGAGKIVRFIARLQREADIQSSIIIDEFLEKRQLQRKLSEVTTDSGRFTASTQRTSSSNHLDPRELDVVLTEMSIMSHRAALYERFFRIRLELESAKVPDTPLDNPYLESRLRRRVMDVMADYVQLEEWFFRKSIEKAVKIDEYEPGSRTSSCVDDVFYILRKSTTRALSTSNADSLCALVGLIGRSLEVDYMHGFQKRLTNSFAVATESAKETKLSFMVLLNNMDVSCDYTQKLAQELEAGALQMHAEASELTIEKIKASIQGLKEYGTSFRSSVKRWIENLFNQLIKPRVRPLLQEASKDVRYALSEDEYNAEATDGGLSTMARRFVNGFTKIMDPFQKGYTDYNYNQTMIYALHYCAEDWERYVFSNYKFTQLGALRFDKDVRDVTSQLTAEASWPTARDKFARMNQIATLLNFDSVAEVNEFVSSKTGSMTWRLKASDVRKVLALRLDFRQEDINSLQA